MNTHGINNTSATNRTNTNKVVQLTQVVDLHLGRGTTMAMVLETRALVQTMEESFAQAAIKSNNLTCVFT